jgi:uncharacterized protein
MDDGLRFECQPGCTRCCDTRGFVYLTERDVMRMAEYVGLEPAEFERRYVFRTAHSLRLRKPRHSQCHFLTATGCGVHPVKPVQCRVYPFWPEYVEHRDLWEYEGKTKCPGIGKGRLVQIGTAMERAQEMRSAYPQHYK